MLIFRTIRSNRSAQYCINLYTTIFVCKEKTIISDMHHCIPSMYIHFQQNLVSKLVKTLYTNLFAKHRELHKFAYYQIVIWKIDYFRHVSLYDIQVYQFSAKSGK